MDKIVLKRKLLGQFLPRLGRIGLKQCIKIPKFKKNQNKSINLTIIKTKFRANSCMKITRRDGFLLE